MEKFVKNLKNGNFRTIFDKFFQISVPLTGTPQNNRWDKFWTNLGFRAFLKAVRGKRVRNASRTDGGRRFAKLVTMVNHTVDPSTPVFEVKHRSQEVQLSMAHEHLILLDLFTDMTPLVRIGVGVGLGSHLRGLWRPGR